MNLVKKHNSPLVSITAAHTVVVHMDISESSTSAVSVSVNEQMPENSWE